MLGVVALVFLSLFGLTLVTWYLAVRPSVPYGMLAVLAGLAAVFSPAPLILLPAMLRLGYERQAESHGPWLNIGMASIAGAMVAGMVVAALGLMTNGEALESFSMLEGTAGPTALLVLGLVGSAVFTLGVVALIQSLFVRREHIPAHMVGRPRPGYGLHFGYGILYVAAGVGISGPLLAGAIQGAAAASPMGPYVVAMLFIEVLVLGLMVGCIFAHRPSDSPRVAPWTAPSRMRLSFSTYQVVAGFLLLMVAFEPDWFLDAFLPEAP